jgi:hypothetical protein
MPFHFNDLECAICYRVPNCKSLRKPGNILRCLGLLSINGNRPHRPHSSRVQGSWAVSRRDSLW